MTLFSEQLSAARKSQWEAQLDTFRTLSSRALDSAEELIALNMRTSRASVEHAAGTFKQLFDAREPRDLALLGAAAQDQWRNLFTYGRDLLGIATGGGLPAWSAPALPLGTIQLLPAPTANVPTTVPQVLEQAAIATADATTTVTEIAAAAADAGQALAEATVHAATQAVPAPVAEAAAVAEPDAAPAFAEAAPFAEAPVQTPAQLADAAIDTAIADDVPPAQAKPLAKALREVAPPPAAAAHPVAATLPLETHGHVELPIVTPADTAPPLRVVEGKPPRASRKK